MKKAVQNRASERIPLKAFRFKKKNKFPGFALTVVAGTIQDNNARKAFVKAAMAYHLNRTKREKAEKEQNTVTRELVNKSEKYDRATNKIKGAILADQIKELKNRETILKQQLKQYVEKIDAALEEVQGIIYREKAAISLYVKIGKVAKQIERIKWAKEAVYGLMAIGVFIGTAIGTVAGVTKLGLQEYGKVGAILLSAVIMIVGFQILDDIRTKYLAEFSMSLHKLKNDLLKLETKPRAE